MKLSDLLIIYLACGSPFGVYQITSGRQERSFRRYIVIAASFLFWPIFVVSLLLRRRSFGEKNAEITANALIENIRAELERVAFAGGETTALFEFREVFYRFTGLFEAANAANTEKTPRALFDVSGHTNKNLASQCLARRNREKLSFHQTLARNEFVDMIADLSRDKKICNEIGRLALELTRHLGDSAATDDLIALLPDQSAATFVEPIKQDPKPIPHSVPV